MGVGPSEQGERRSIGDREKGDHWGPDIDKRYGARCGWREGEGIGESGPATGPTQMWRGYVREQQQRGRCGDAMEVDWYFDVGGFWRIVFLQIDERNGRRRARRRPDGLPGCRWSLGPEGIRRADVSRDTWEAKVGDDRSVE